MDEKIILKLIEKAERKLAAARKLYEERMYEDTISRAYYEMFHAVQALLLTKNITIRTHSGLLSMLRLHFIKTGLLEEEYYDMISRDKDLRENGDYEPFYIPSIDEAKSVVEDAEKFVRRIREFLKL